MSNAADAPLARFPAVHVTIPTGAWTQPALADTNVELAGRVSVTLTPVAAAGPLFVATRWYVRLCPSVTSAGPVLRTARSAPFTVTVIVSTKAGPPESPFSRKSTVQLSVWPPGLVGETVIVSV